MDRDHDKCNCVKSDVCTIAPNIRHSFCNLFKIRFGGTRDISDLNKLIRETCEYRVEKPPEGKKWVSVMDFSAVKERINELVCSYTKKFAGVEVELSDVEMIEILNIVGNYILPPAPEGKK